MRFLSSFDCRKRATWNSNKTHYRKVANRLTTAQMQPETGAVHCSKNRKVSNYSQQPDLLQQSLWPVTSVNKALAVKLQGPSMHPLKNLFVQRAVYLSRDLRWVCIPNNKKRESWRGTKLATFWFSAVQWQAMELFNRMRWTSMEWCNACALEPFSICHRHNSLPLGPIQPSSPSAKKLHGQALCFLLAPQILHWLPVCFFRQVFN